MPSIDAASGPRSPRQHDPDPPPPTVRTGAPPPSGPSRRADAAIDANVAAAARSFNDRILYLGFNASSFPTETAALGPNLDVKIAARDGAVVERGGRSFDLASSPEIDAFVRQLPISGDQKHALSELLGKAPQNGRDELARMAMAWIPAENGASIPSRLVISGHSSLGLVWGEGEVGILYLQSIRSLGTILPKAAAQIEDVHISGCFSEAEVQHSEKWTTAFPNLKSIWAYGGFAPLAPARDLADWQAATQGRNGRLGEAMVASHGTATAWSIAGGVAHPTSSVDDRRALVQDADSRFDAYFSGQTRIPGPHEPVPDRDYGAYQSLAAHRDATPSERAQAEARGGQMLRLRFWETSVRQEIAKHDGAAINAALSKQGLAPVDFATLSRKDALDVIDRYRQSAGTLGPIMDGIAKLSPTTIPPEWCH